MVEHAAVNRGVVGSSPTRGVKPANTEFAGFLLSENIWWKSEKGKYQEKAGRAMLTGNKNGIVLYGRGCRLRWARRKTAFYQKRKFLLKPRYAEKTWVWAWQTSGVTHQAADGDRQDSDGGQPLFAGRSDTGHPDRQKEDRGIGNTAEKLKEEETQKKQGIEMVTPAYKQFKS